MEILKSLKGLLAENFYWLLKDALLPPYQRVIGEKSDNLL